MGDPAGHDGGRVTRGEYGFALRAAILIVALTCVPYLLAWYATPEGLFYPGILHNADDHGVYFAWMRQAHDGHFFLRNLFTNEPQHGQYVHLWFWLLGTAARLTELSIPLVYHVARCLAGVAVLVLVYRLAAHFTEDRFTRQTIFWTTALSAGLGWWRWSEKVDHGLPVDTWQPEAFTFHSLYTNGLFAISLALMLGVVVGLLLAERRGKLLYAAAAGVCGLLLANVHTYDVISLALVWAVYLAVSLLDPAARGRRWRAALVAALVALPGVAYQVYYYRLETVWQKRIAVRTPSPDLELYLWGYGLLLPLALLGALVLLRSRPLRAAPHHLLPLVWIGAGFAAIYLPVAFQRKLVMGLHFPIALLAGIGLARWSDALGSISRVLPRAAIAACAVALLAVTPLRYVQRDWQQAVEHNVTSTGIHPVWWPGTDFAAIESLGRNASRDTVLFRYPIHAVLVPAFSGCTVYAGHWGETPDFQRKVNEATCFFSGREAQPEAFLRQTGARHVLYGAAERFVAEDGRQRGAPGFQPGSWLREVYREGDTVLYEVAPPMRN